LQTSASIPDISTFSRNLPTGGHILALNNNPSEFCKESDRGSSAGNVTSELEQRLRAVLKGRELRKISQKELKSELEKRGLTKTGNKATLAKRLKSAILEEDPRPNSTRHSVANGVEAVEISDEQPETTDCPCYDRLSLLIADLKSEIFKIKRRQDSDRPIEVTGSESSSRRLKDR